MNWIHRCYQETTAWLVMPRNGGEISAGALIVRVKLFAGDSFRDTLQGLRRGECYEICFVQPFEHLKVPDENVPRLESEIRTFFSLFICQAEAGACLD